jgi:antitoxin HicB
MPTERRYSLVLEPQADGGFTVLVPALPEVVTEGDTEEEAVRMAEEAIRAVLDYRRDHGLPIPDDVAPTLREVRIAAAE